MGIVFNAFANGTTMVAADVQTELEKVRLYLNGGVVAADVVGPFRRQHFHRTRSYGGTVARTLGVVGDSHYGSIGAAPHDRAVMVYEQDDEDADYAWRWVEGACRTVEAPAAGRVAVAVSLWAWHVGVATTQIEWQGFGNGGTPGGPAEVRVAFAALGDDATGVGGSKHPVQTAGYNADFGYQRYAGKPFVVHGLVTIPAAGTYTVGVQAFMRPANKGGGGGGVALNGHMYVGARSPLVSYHRT